MSTFPRPGTLAAEARALLDRLGVPAAALSGSLSVRSPLTGETIASIAETDAAGATAAIGQAHEAFLAWRAIPGPRRGELVRLLGEELRASKADLGRLVTIEAGKITSEGLGEVQEMIDICDYAVGLSRQLQGLTIATERPDHRMMETWHPIGVVGVISAFNFPVAVWSWNAALAFVCGDSVVWKPSEKDPAHGAGRAGHLREGVRPLRRRAGRSLHFADRRQGGGVRRWWTTSGCPSSPPQVPPPWAARSARASRHGSRARSSNSAATMPPSSARARTWISRCAPLPSPPWAPPASAAPRCAVSSCTRASMTRCWRA